MKRKQVFIVMAIFTGGALGALFRFFINIPFKSFLFPVSTVIENVLGSFLLGILFGYASVKIINEMLKEGIGVGFCGGFTTMSTFAADSIVLIENGSVQTFFLYITLSLFGGILLSGLGILLGMKVAKRKTKVGEQQ